MTKVVSCDDDLMKLLLDLVQQMRREGCVLKDWVDLITSLPTTMCSVYGMLTGHVKCEVCLRVFRRGRQQEAQATKGPK